MIRPGANAPRRPGPLRLALAIGILGGCTPPVPVGQVGGNAPPFEARSLGGETVALADFRESVVLLNAWATWCPPCRVEIPELSRLQAEFGAEGLVVLGVSIDGTEDLDRIRDFAAEFGIRYPLVVDPENRVSAAFAFPGIPSTVLIDGRGRVRWRHVGPVTSDDPALRAALAGALGLPPPPPTT